jgi:hypothetical protein
MPLPLGLNARLQQVGIAAKNIEQKPRWQPWGVLNSVRMPPLYAFEGEGCTAAKHDVFVPTAAGVDTSQKAHSTSCILYWCRLCP